MFLDTSSFPAYLRSLNVTTPIVTKAGPIVAGPPAPVLDLALRLGIGSLIFNTPRNRAILDRLGIPPENAAIVARRLRARAQWRAVWEELATPHIPAAEQAAAQGETGTAIQEIRLALALLGMAYGGDNYYFHTPMQERRKVLQVMEKLYGLLRQVMDEQVVRLPVAHAHGKTPGLLHFPPGGTRPARCPALLAIHPVAGDKDSFDHTLATFREAGYATFCVDLPAHGENLDGPRLQPDDEVVGVAALEALASHPQIDPARLGVIGGSLGAFFALRTAAASPLVKACLAFASPFDIGQGLPKAVPGIQAHLAWVLGAASLHEAYQMARPFHLRDVVGKIRAPICLVHGTQDHICDFTASYEIARRAATPLTVHPLIGVDHEAAQPSTPHLAAPGIEWLRNTL
ncbi:MAG: alpha/beta hydrolase family protein [Anaerolineales bacterium]